MAQIQTGTVVTSLNSQVIKAVGSDVDWSGVIPGDWFSRNGDGVTYTIASTAQQTLGATTTYNSSLSYSSGAYSKFVSGSIERLYIAIQPSSGGDPHSPTETDYWRETSGWTLTLTAQFAGGASANVAYAITKDFTGSRQLPLMTRGDVETAAIFSRAMQILDPLAAGASPEVYILRDEFDRQIGTEGSGWFVFESGGGGTIGNSSTAALGRVPYGRHHVETAAVANSSIGLFHGVNTLAADPMNHDNAGLFGSMKLTEEWEFWFSFTSVLSSVTNARMRVGLEDGNWASSIEVIDVIEGFGLRLDTAGSTWLIDVAKLNGGGPSSISHDTGISYTAGDIMTFRAKSPGNGNDIVFDVSARVATTGVLQGRHSWTYNQGATYWSGNTSGGHSPVFAIKTLENAAKGFYMDYFGFRCLSWRQL